MQFKLIQRYPAFVRLGIFLSLLLLTWLPLAFPLSIWLRNQPNLMTILIMGWLFVNFLILIQIWGRAVYQNPQILRAYGWDFSQQNRVYLIKGICIGFGLCLSLFIVESYLGFIDFQASSFPVWRLIFEGMLCGLGVSFAEELVFRGWLLFELEKDYQPNISLGLSSLIFALSHFLKPLAEIIRTFPTLPALILLGIILVWAKRCYHNKLGICIGIHAGLVWSYYIINVGDFVVYLAKIPPLITGIDENPIAGLMGLLFLSLLAIYFQKKYYSLKQK